ncbi:MAG: hypothetical protein HY826_12065 [Actinobacteria bacterium]|nr:hypothetical protein [Actinomycetota bacterium]
MEVTSLDATVLDVGATVEAVAVVGAGVPMGTVVAGGPSLFQTRRPTVPAVTATALRPTMIAPIFQADLLRPDRSLRGATGGGATSWPGGGRRLAAATADAVDGSTSGSRIDVSGGTTVATGSESVRLTVPWV